MCSEHLYIFSLHGPIDVLHFLLRSLRRCWLGHLTRTVVPEMIYIVSSGMLNGSKRCLDTSLTVMSNDRRESTTLLRRFVKVEQTYLDGAVKLVF